MESIPEGLEFNSSTTHPSIFQAWLNLLGEARSSLDIASFYWTLTNKDTGTHEPTAHQVSWSWEWYERISYGRANHINNGEIIFSPCAQGETILRKLAELSGKLSVRIAVNTPQESQPQDDLRLLNDSGDTVFKIILLIW